MTQEPHPDPARPGDVVPSTDEHALLSANRIRRILAVVTLLGAAVFLYASWDMSAGTLARPGPGLMPRLVGIGLLASAALALFERVGPRDDLDPAPDGGGGRRQALVLVSLAGYVGAIPALGFVLSSAVAMSLVAWLLNDKGSVKRALIIGIAVAVVIDVTFRLLLGVNLPAGLLDIRTA